MTKHILLLSFALLVTSVSHAAEDPMRSLFTFQQTMADHGSVAAMMKLGEMYEQGSGTKKDFNKAIEMYREAKAKGNTEADAAIARVMRTRQALAQANQRKQEQTAQDKRRQKARLRAEAERKAQSERQAKEQARQKALAKQRAEQARRKARAEEARREAQSKKAARARAIAEAAQKAQQKDQQEQARLRQARAQANTQQTQTQQHNASSKPETFKSDPCKGPAARVMSICK